MNYELDKEIIIIKCIIVKVLIKYITKRSLYLVNPDNINPAKN